MQFGWNVHTLAYVLMCIVIVSGMFGAYVYWRYPAMIAANRSNLTRDQMLEQIADLDRRGIQLGKEISNDVAELMTSAANRTQLGGGAWNQSPREMRSANRWRDFPSRRSDDTGFRVLRELHY